MANIQIIQGDFEKKLKLQFAPGIRAVFPSPAEDYNHETLDFNRDLIRNPEATFYGKVEGDSMIEAGINDGDIAVIDRSLEPRDGDIVVGYINEEFTIKYLDLSHRNDGYIELRPANKVNGTETIVLGSQQYTQKDGKGKANVFANAIKHDFKSKNPTTRWSDIIRLK